MPMDHASSKSVPRNDPLRGALFVLGFSLSLSILGGMIKLASASVPGEMIVFFRNLFGLLFVLPMVFRNGVSGLGTSCPHLYFLRVCAGLGAMYCFFFTIANMKLAEATLFLYTNPLFIPIIAFVWLSEPVPFRVRAAIVAGFVGIAFILRPGPDVFRYVSLIGLCSGLLAALAMVTVRKMSVTEPASRIVFWFAVAGTAVSAVPLIWAWKNPTLDIWILLVLIGCLATVGQLLVTKAFSCAPAARVGPFTYATVVFSALVGNLFWGETLDWLFWIGAGLIFAAGVLSSGK